MIQDQTAPQAANTATTAAEAEPLIVTEFALFSDKLKHLIEEPTWANAIDTFLPVFLEVGKVIFVAVILLIIVSFISRWAQRAAAKGLERTRLDPTVRNFFIRLVKYAVWILAIPIALSVLGVQATSLAAVIGAAGLAIGLGVQGALSNISAGILLVFLRPVRIGDVVNIQGDSGEVRDLGLFYTTINTFTNEVVYIPNQRILSDKVQNFTGNAVRRVDIPVGVAYGTDLRLATDTLMAAARSAEGRDPAQDPRVWLTGFGGSSIDFVVQVFCPARSFVAVRHAAILAINDALNKQGIEIPFPQRTLSGQLRLVKDDDR